MKFSIMYMHSDLSCEPALRHHHLEAEAQVECEAPWVLVWAGFHCTGRLFPTLYNTQYNTVMV